MRRGGAGRASDRPPFFSERGRRPRSTRAAWFSSCKHCSQCTKSCRLWLMLRCGRKVRFIVLHMRSRASIAIGPSQRSFNGSTCTYRRALSTPHGLLPSDYQDQRPEHRAHAVRGHRGRRPLSLKKRRSVRGSPCAPEAPAAPRSAAPRPGHLPRPARCPPPAAPRRLRDLVSAARCPPPPA